ncbi:hypothetical protein CVT24_005893 [Panaeolus cyanescens]|uniref:F-box domain-containing protein n=1 Tax=Panaeolus cyanescens TaxID=181874 RepID=A0A409WH11_9AGAR|nr:hypothetical protein CVT24_005893 [Panaeolus cyanescens]
MAIGQFMRGWVNPLDLERLKLFGKRIRTLTFSEGSRVSGVVGSSAAVTIASALRGECLFPNLEKLVWELQGDSNATLPLCISPGLRKVDVYAHYTALDPTWADGIFTFVQSLAHSNVQLSELTVHVPCSHSMVNIIPSAFSKLKSLHLTLDHGSDRSFDLAFLRGLTQLDHLETLNLDCPFFALDLPEGHSSLCFQHVKQLYVTCPFDDVFNLLAITTFPSLYSFDFEFILPLDLHETYEYDWKRLLGAIHGVASPSKVHGISLIPWRPVWTDNDVHYHFFRKFYPGVPFEDLAESLLRFKLIHFICPFPLFRSLTMDNLKAIVRPWRFIGILYLYTADASEGNAVGLDALHYLASNLPFLFNLSIALDASVGTMNTTPARFGQSVEAFSVRLFRNKRLLSTVSELASHVDTLFPNLRTYRELAANWDDVNEEDGSMFTQLVSVIKQARERERNHISAAGCPEKTWLIQEDILYRRIVDMIRTDIMSSRSRS